MEKLRTDLHSDLLGNLLLRNRRRCCVCHNPSNAVEIYLIDENRSSITLNNLVPLCKGCSNLALSCEQEFGASYLKKELYRYKQVWEHECNVWRNGPDFLLRIKQGDSIRDLFEQDICEGLRDLFEQDIYEDDIGGNFFKASDWCELDKGGEMLIDLTSDELVAVSIYKATYESQPGDTVYLGTGDGYEFSLKFTAPKEGSYAIFLSKRSFEKTTVNLAISIFLSIAREQEEGLKEMIAWRTSQNAQASERESIDASVERVPWKILPPGEHPFLQILRYYEGLQEEKKNIRYELERLHQISTLNPSKTYCGIDEFKGYVVFVFQESNSAVLDCPLVGNAIYLLKGDWKSLSRLSKNELLKEHAQDVTRIVHSGDWFYRLKRLMHKHCSA